MSAELGSLLELQERAAELAKRQGRAVMAGDTCVCPCGKVWTQPDAPDGCPTCRAWLFEARPLRVERMP